MCMGFPVCVAEFQSPERPSSSNSLARCDLVPDRLLGTAMSSPHKVTEPAWFGSQCWIRYTSMSSGVADCMVLMPVVCSHSVSSMTAVCLALAVAALTTCCCRSAAQARPFPYRSKQCVLLSCVAFGSAV